MGKQCYLTEDASWYKHFMYVTLSSWIISIFVCVAFILNYIYYLHKQNNYMNKNPDPRVNWRKPWLLIIYLSANIYILQRRIYIYRKINSYSTQLHAISSNAERGPSCARAIAPGSERTAAGEALFLTSDVLLLDRARESEIPRRAGTRRRPIAFIHKALNCPA